MKVCVYVPVACPNGCNEVMPRLAMEKHKFNACPKRQVSCEYCRTLVLFQEIEVSNKRLNTRDMFLFCAKGASND